MPAAHPLTLRPGVNVYGYFRAEHGVGEAARLLVQCISEAGVEHTLIPYTATGSRQQARLTMATDPTPDFDINIIVVNADSLPDFVNHYGAGILNRRYNIGVWAWEVETLPERLARSARFLDEIWAISRFTADAIGRAVLCPVLSFPLTSSMVEPPVRPRAELGLPEGFIFLFCFDFNSIFDRKNPIAAIEAFRRAFPPGAGATLLIKTLNGQEFPDQMERLCSAALDHQDVIVVDGYLSSEERHVLMNSCDCYVSLHRSEGFGLTLMEAMAYGKPVIATSYSGNLDFMSEENSFLVPYQPIEIPPGCGPYPAGSTWADPDVGAAAEMMRRVLQQPDEARRKAVRARTDIRRLHNPQARALLIGNRLRTIRKQLDEGILRRRHDGPGPVRVAKPKRSATAKGAAVARRPYTAFGSVRELMEARLVQYSEHAVHPVSGCGSLDGGLLDRIGGASVWGWAFDPRSKKPASSVIVLLNGQQIAIRIPVSSIREDVARHLCDPRLTATGWSLYIPPRMLSPGANEVEAFAVLEDGQLGRLPSRNDRRLVLRRPRPWNLLTRLRERMP